MTRGGSLGWLSAFLFNLSLFAMPLAAVNAWRALQDTNVYVYEATAAARQETRRALEEAAESVMQPGADRQAAWSAIIQRELDEGDLVAARGFLLCARTMLPQESAVSLEAQLPAGADDDARERIALVFLDEAVRRQYQAGASPLAAAPGQAAAASAAFSVLGDMNDVALQSSRWLAGDPVDVFILSLSGAGVALSASGQPVSVGASVIKTAKRAGKLSAAYSNEIEKLVRAAVPPQRLKQELAKAFADGKAPDDAKAATAAFKASVDDAGFRALEAELAQVKALADAAGPAGAVQLLSHAQDAADLKRLRLLAESGGPRAVALAKRATTAKVLGAAQGTLKMTDALWRDVGAFAATVIVFAASFLFTLGAALLAEWRHGHHGQDADHDEHDEHEAHA